MDEETKPALTERQIKQQEREQKTKDRVNAEKALKAEYHKIAKSPALLDLLAKVKSFADYHTKVAKDGVGFQESRDDEGALQQMVIRLEPAQRLTELDKAAGIQEIIDYLDRKITIDTSTNKKEDTNGQ